VEQVKQRLGPFQNKTKVSHKLENAKLTYSNGSFYNGQINPQTNARHGFGTMVC
jgi:hypothetical protein